MSVSNPSDIGQRLALIRLLAMDVDGVLTDGGIIFAGADTETKRFHVADGLGIQLAIKGGLIIAWITGRTSPAVEKRASELGVPHLFHDAHNKAACLAQLMATYTLSQANIAYIGDDLNDLPAYSLAGVKIAPPNAVNHIKAVADMITEKSGGNGAVREVCDAILQARNKWNDAVSLYLSDILNG